MAHNIVDLTSMRCCRLDSAREAKYKIRSNSPFSFKYREVDPNLGGDKHNVYTDSFTDVSFLCRFQGRFYGSDSKIRPYIREKQKKQ